MATDAFSYVTGEKEDLLVILLYGQIRSQEVEILEEIQTFIKTKTQPIVIINFRDVSTFMPAAHAAFARMQVSLRKEGRLLALCSLNPDIKMVLLAAGVVRESEIFNNVPAAWKALKMKREREATKPEVSKPGDSQKRAA